MPAAQRTALFSVLAAAGLVVLKLITGLLTNSLGLIAEALHSATDLVAALLTYFALRLSHRAADRRHPFGHGKAEHLAALAESTALVAASAFIVYQASRRLVGDGGAHVEGHWWAIAVLVVVMVVDASRAWISWRVSRNEGSAALRANALHFASDLLGTFAVLVGLLFVRAGYQSADAIAALIVAGLVVVAAAGLIRENVDVLMDRASLDAEATVRRVIKGVPHPISLTRLRIREAAGTYFADVVVSVPADVEVTSAHAAADAVEDAIEEALPGSDVTVHVEPRSTDELALRDAIMVAARSVPGVREVHNVLAISGVRGVDVSLHVKLPPTLTLAAAHDLASEVERRIKETVTGIRDVVTHIEPLTETLDATTAATYDAATLAAGVRATIRTALGAEALDVRLLDTPDGPVAHVELPVSAGLSLVEAHDEARRIEHAVRRAHPALGEIVIHTEPAET